VSEPIPVYLVQLGTRALPLSLGLLEAYARAHGGEHCARLDFRRLRDPSAEEIAGAETGIWLFPDYIWSYAKNVMISRAVKQANPRSLTVHGGPSAPKYPDACERFLRRESHVDVAVRAEGEVTTTALLDHLAAALEAGADWRDGLAVIEGIAYLAAPDGAMVRTPDRERIKDLAAVPSPYLDGTLERWLVPGLRLATLETSRGCPYGCTFCDWGSATLQKIHKFDLERIKAETEWIAAHGLHVLFVSDANFGMFDRDVEIAEHIGNMRRRYGFPKETIVSYAKNGNERLPEIVRAMVSAGVVTEGVISIQTRDPDALNAVHRSNIKTSHYEKLIADYRRLGLPATTDLMIGLPGATLASHKRDVQWCLDEDLVARFFRTSVLPNSPMADPKYMEEHGIEERDGFVVSTAMASEEELMQAWDLVHVYELFEKATVLRYVLRYLQWEHGFPASELLFSLARALRQEPERFPPYLARFPRRMECLNAIVADPAPFYDSIWGWARDALRIPLGSEADRVVFQLNAAVVPRRGASYPIEVEAHWNVLDYFASCIAPKPGESRKLSRLDPPQAFRISDPRGLASLDYAEAVIDNNALRVFELHWPVMNPAMFIGLYATT
jgi:radical SAM superfamily enzyme YgiQ (UPF0313 family)